MDRETLLNMDPNILVSLINLKLRDYYNSLEMLCDDMSVEKVELEKKLIKAGFSYSEAVNQFR